MLPKSALIRRQPMLSRDKPAYVMSCYATSRSIETKQPPRLSNIMVYSLVQASASRAEHDAEKGNWITETKQQRQNDISDHSAPLSSSGGQGSDRTGSVGANMSRAGCCSGLMFYVTLTRMPQPARKHPCQGKSNHDKKITVESRRRKKTLSRSQMERMFLHHLTTNVWTATELPSQAQFLIGSCSILSGVYCVLCTCKRSLIKDEDEWTVVHGCPRHHVSWQGLKAGY
ncbi:hypothetical protein M432DRAFT_45518 [Thermoascus aurantiacus ATCC 26904]